MYREITQGQTHNVSSVMLSHPSPCTTSLKDNLFAATMSKHTIIQKLPATSSRLWSHLPSCRQTPRKAGSQKPVNPNKITNPPVVLTYPKERKNNDFHMTLCTYIIYLRCNKCVFVRDPNQGSHMMPRQPSHRSTAVLLFPWFSPFAAKPGVSAIWK